MAQQSSLKSVTASSVMPACSQAGRGTGPGETEPSKREVFWLQQYLGLAHGNGSWLMGMVPHSPVGMRQCLERTGLPVW